ncbi:gamma-butyrobetaine dioxygenase [Emericellopsis cladophorae]|uniref:Gamma-butyrobetaine dioxygenase n=1 Tax=Emericellopsis cladophorae TaxID=2686198 RepID=A0A9P9Y8L5_9HYPO|nr:gamma-butyrobetaine dioxygenase [Emericellopsis cladophorae]KAI6784995.1 gamma-butyrobetaine dioxygenase [Emericellopsis cladophorae]
MKPLRYLAMVWAVPKNKGAGNIRDSCCCPLCRNPSSGQKTFSTPEVPMSPRILNVEASTDGGLKVSLDQDLVSAQHSQVHEVLLNGEYLAQQNILQSEAHSAPPPLQPVYWDRTFIEKNARFVDYDEFMQEDSAAFWDVMEDLEVLGLVYLRNVPRDDQSVVRIGEHIGNLRETFYGRTFDVRAKPNAENVAYTNEYLGLHQDLLYLDEQPHIQILHCMDNTAQGGESLFSDADRIGRMLYALRSEFPPLADLVEYKVRYAYDRNGYYYENTRPLLEEQNVGEFRTVRWSPPFQGHQPSGWNMSDWLASARVFERCVNAEDAVYERKMAPGECVLFNNLRVLHGRKSFDLGDGGKRWLRGTYLGRDVFASRLHYMPKDRLRRAERSAARTVHDLLNDLSGSPDFEGLRRELRADPHIGKS